jgi:hypothetical protein
MAHRSSHAVHQAPTTRRQLLVDALAGASAVGLSSIGCAPATSQGSRGNTAVPAALPTGNVHDFDFFVGHWNGVNRRLKQRWVGSTDWDEFPGSLRCESRLAGVVNISEVEFPTKNLTGLTVRSFDLESRRWSAYWINSTTGKLFPPLLGGFSGDRGEFYGDDTDDGRPIKVQVVWTRLGPDVVHWQQAFSADGVRWETNWTVEQRRAKTMQP